MRPRQHRNFRIGASHRLEFRAQVTHLRDQHFAPRGPEHQCVGQVVDILGGAGKVQEVLERACFRAFAELLADEVLDRLDVMIGGGFDRLDALGMADLRRSSALLERFHDASIDGSVFATLRGF